MKRLWADLLWALDDLDDDGNPDHGKLIVDCIIWAIIIAQFIGHPFPVSIAATLVIAGAGQRAIMAAIKAGVWGVKTETTTSVTETITTRRDLPAGLEPTA